MGCQHGRARPLQSLQRGQALQLWNQLLEPLRRRTAGQTLEHLREASGQRGSRGDARLSSLLGLRPRAARAGVRHLGECPIDHRVRESGRVHRQHLRVVGENQKLHIGRLAVQDPATGLLPGRRAHMTHDPGCEPLG